MKSLFFICLSQQLLVATEDGINELALQQVRSIDGELGKLKTIIIIIIRPVERG